jgi:hypothetical protein
MELSNLSIGHSRAWFLTGVFLVMLVLSLNMATTLRQAPWEDEVFTVSTSLSMSRSEPPNLSVLAQYPNTKSPIYFYGPVSFEVEKFLIRAFGLSPIPWRLVCSLGVLLTLASCVQLVKVAGGDKWGSLLVGLTVALSSSVFSPFPGRWDAFTVGLFLCGIAAFLSALNDSTKSSIIKLTATGLLMGISAASTPRTLTLALAFLVAACVTATLSKNCRKRLLLASFYSLSIALAIHNVFLLPWGQNSVSWYRAVRRATKADFINATPITGGGQWGLELPHHRVLVIAILLFAIAAALSAVGQRLRRDPEYLPFKVFLTAFGAINLILMLIVVANALGQASFWVPPIVVAGGCWIGWDNLRNNLKPAFIAIFTLCLLVMGLEEAEQAGSVMLTWDQRNTKALTAFVHLKVPPGSVVYGPIGDFFYAVELAGNQYLYAFEHTTPGLYSQPQKSVPDIGEKLDQMICSSRAYVIWPKTDLEQQPFEQAMPEPLRDRLQQPIAEFHQPALPEWKQGLLSHMGNVGGKNGFPSVILYSTKSARCPHR